MNWLVFLITLFISLAKVADFLFGDGISPYTKKFLYELYFGIEENWRFVYQKPAYIIAYSLEKILFSRSCIIFSIIKIIFYSIFMTLFVTFFVVIYVVCVYHKFSLIPFISYYARVSSSVIVGNIFSDLILWPISIKMLRKISNSGAILAIFLIIIIFMMMYTVAAVAVSLGLVGASIIYVLQDGVKVLFFSAFYTAIWELFKISVSVHLSELYEMFFIFDAEDFFPGSIIQVIQTGIPVLLFLVVLSLIVIIYPFRKTIKRPILFVIEKIELHPKSIFIIFAAIMSGISTLIAAWLKSIG